MAYKSTITICNTIIIVDANGNVITGTLNVIPQFVCVGSNGKSYYSTDGTSWTAMSGLDSNYDCDGVTYGNGRFVCVGNDGKSYYSTNGTSWTAMTGLDSSVRGKFALPAPRGVSLPSSRPFVG